ncbi:glutathione S-transferase 3-like [Stegastes partitus]|uniref:glutathione transferase n=1 Tax=Stegastes partitus TaxID=144197 RepID=A0A3B4ZJH6_9TELE|nr:PREDICTED: glutathione S-transferase 3-like [Stegastes partitus]
MSQRAVLHYFNGRGKMESIRWLLTLAEAEYDEMFLTSRDQYVKLLNDGSLMFQQVPMVEIDGMKLVQTKAIFQYIAEKYNLHGKDPKERAIINMHCEGLMDLMEMMMILPFCADPKPQLEKVKTKANERYLPVFEKAVTGPVYLVGGRVTCADVLLFECILMLEEKFCDILKEYDSLRSFKGRMLSIPALHRFLQPGSKRKPQPDENYTKTVKEVFQLNIQF